MSSRSKAAVNIHEERERGFRTHFSGANDDGKRLKNINAPIVAVRNTNPIRNPIRERARKGWAAEPPKFILGADGPIQLRAPKQSQNDDQLPSKQYDETEVIEEEDDDEEHEELSNNLDDSIESVYEDHLHLEPQQPQQVSEYVNEFDEDFEVEEEYVEEAFEEFSDDDGMDGGTQPGALAKVERAHVAESHANSSVLVSQDDSSVYFNEKITVDRSHARVVSTAQVQQRSSKPVIRPASAVKKSNSINLEDYSSASGVDDVAAAILRENSAMKSKVSGEVSATALEQVVPNTSKKHQLPGESRLISRGASDGNFSDVTEARPRTENRSESTTDALLRRLANLDPEKQQLLLGLLNKLDSPADIGMGSPRLPSKAPHEVQQAEELNISTVIPEARVEQALDERKYSDAEEFVEVAPHTNRLSAVPELLALKLRIRIHTTWGKTKTASLGTLRLRLVGSDEDIDLSTLTCKATSGLLPLPQTSETVRSLPSLFYKSNRTSALGGGWRPAGGECSVWRGPLETGKSLEVSIDGPISLRAEYDSSQGMLDDLELWVWNADTDGVSFVGSTATRDMDVFVGQTCVWSGQLNQPVIPAKPSALLKKVLGDPSVKIPLVKQEIQINKKPYATITSKAVERTSLDTVAVDQNMGTATMPDTQPSQQPSPDADPSKPVWLSAVSIRGSGSGSGRGTQIADDIVDDSPALSTKPIAVVPRRRWGSGAAPASEPGANPFAAGLSEALRGNNRMIPENLPPAAKDAAFPLPEERRRSRWDAHSSDVTDTSQEEQPAIRVGRPSSREPGGERRRPRERSVDGNSEQKTEAVRKDSQPSNETDPATAVAGGIAAIVPRKRRSSLTPSPMPNVPSVVSGAPDPLASAAPVRVGNASDFLPSVAGLVDATDVLSKQQDAKAMVGNAKEDASKDKRVKVREINVTGDRSSRAQAAAGGGDEMSLRRSLEAVQQSDRLSRGRLEYCVDPKDRDSRLKLRAQRIDEVNVQVQSALASLATVMSSISNAGGQRRRQESGGPSKGTPATIQEEEEEATEDRTSDEQLTVDEILSDLAELQPPRQQVDFPDAACGPLESSLCEIPYLPKGKRLVLQVLSTWGDPHYVGLNGIELFDEAGDVLGPEAVEIVVADPPDINVLEEYQDDPRVAGNLLDGCNFTRNDLHVWLAPHGTLMTYDEPLVAVITVDLRQATTLSLIRVWNYNKSRTHCYRGVRRCRIKLDDAVVFDGEIKIAPGVLDSAEACSEVVLFTLDREVLTKVARHDEERGLVVKDSKPKWLSEAELTRPGTAGGLSETVEGVELPIKRKVKATPPQQPYEVSAVAGRPTTAAIRPEKKAVPVVTAPFRSVSDSQNSRQSDQPKAAARCKDTGTIPEADLCLCSCIGLHIETTWGDPSYVGLTGLEVLVGTACTPARDIDPEGLLADPWDLSAIGCFDDYRVPSNVLNGINDTTDDRNMWLIPYTPGDKHLLTVDLGDSRKVAGFRVWNYNKSLEDTLRGARQVSVIVDGQTIGRTLLRPGPGCDGVEFGQTVLFRDLFRPAPIRPPVNTSQSYSSPSVRQDYETPTLPSGLLWKFTLYTNCGDQYFIGLDAIELYDPSGRRIDVAASGRVAAVPHSLRDLASSPLDSRLPENLFSAAGRDSTGLNSWLSPLAPCMTEMEREASGLRVMRKQPGYSAISARYENSKAQMVAAGAFDVEEEDEKADEELYLFEPQNLVFVSFDQPVTVAYIRIFNYSKTPARGVRDFGLEVDGRLLFMGTLVAADKGPVEEGQSVLFTNDVKIVRSEKSKVFYCGTTEQDVLCINEKQVMVRSKGMFEQPNATTAGIYTDIDNRPVTSLQR